MVTPVVHELTAAQARTTRMAHAYVPGAAKAACGHPRPSTVAPATGSAEACGACRYIVSAVRAN